MTTVNEKAAMKKVLGLTFWQRNWSLTVVIVTSPVLVSVGIVTGAYPFDSQKIDSASQMIVGFASLLAAAWTFGFAYFWPNTEQETRKTRTRLMRTRPILSNNLNIDQALQSLRTPFWTFLLAVFGLVLMIFSAFLALAASLYNFRSLIVVSIWALAAASTMMIGSWVQLYLARHLLSFISDLAPSDE